MYGTLYYIVLCARKFSRFRPNKIFFKIKFGAVCARFRYKSRIFLRFYILVSMFCTINWTIIKQIIPKKPIHFLTN